MSRGFRVDLPDPSRLSDGVVRAAMPEAAELVKDRAVKLAPVVRGTLREGIEARVEKGGLQGVVASTAKHSYIVHEGTKAHYIGPDKKRALKLPGEWLRANVHHPGSAGQPFLEQALEESGDDLERLFRQDGEGMLRKAMG